MIQTKGNVQFVDSGTAWNDNLVAITNGQAIMRANTDNNVGNRQSIRITDSYTFNDNTLILMDAAHMPTGYVLLISVTLCRLNDLFIHQLRNVARLLGKRSQLAIWR
jgi:hypothetical protein